MMKIKTFEEYRQEFRKIWLEPKYFGLECFIPGCHEPAEYEGGDARFYCGVCEKHSRLYNDYNFYIKDMKKRIAINTYNKPKNPNIDYNKYTF